MPNRLSFTSTKIVLFVLGILALPSPALAGFQWVSPTETVSPSPSPAIQPWSSTAPGLVPVVPAPTSGAMVTANPEIISPVIIDGNHAPSPAPSSAVIGTPSTNINSGVNQRLGTLTASPAVGGRQPLAPLTIAPATSLLAPAGSSSASSSDIVRGFAKQVPLAVALRQMLPAGYGFSVDPDVDLGVLISFQGGKPWRETLKEALDPAGLAMREQGQMVSIGHAESPLLSASAAASLVGGGAPLPPPTAAPTPLVSTPVGTGPMVDAWKAERGDSLHKVMETWSHYANIELNWMAEYDYPLQASVSFTGTFEDAVRNLLSGFESAHPQPVAELHENAHLGQKVLVVETRGNSYSD